ncbi:CLUMA_CG016355, isoform A [Clunio marinus]|uniref:CLUMA_CG016355, isoform A n=1 Tax=Clunio marinus TaxID=568069 RepID=A0A1J1IW30_9DIPT|nr:CLUMA_CG016355, isoform A [Clunio marinus]
MWNCECIGSEVKFHYSTVTITISNKEVSII